MQSKSTYATEKNGPLLELIQANKYKGLKSDGKINPCLCADEEKKSLMDIYL
jgi:hypothetical protein